MISYAIAYAEYGGLFYRRNIFRSLDVKEVLNRQLTIIVKSQVKVIVKQNHQQFYARFSQNSNGAH